MVKQHIFFNQRDCNRSGYRTYIDKQGNIYKSTDTAYAWTVKLNHYLRSTLSREMSKQEVEDKVKAKKARKGNVYLGCKTVALHEEHSTLKYWDIPLRWSKNNKV